MDARLRRLANTAVIRLLRPYVSRELPGWGVLHRRFVGDATLDARWRGEGERWVRGKLHGYEMRLDLSGWSNRATYFLGRFYDLPTQLVLTALLRDGDTFVDIGANEGMISLLAARLVGPSGKVVAFEPNPRPRASLEAAIERNRIAHIDLRPVGLADAAGTLTMSVPKHNSGEGSFGRPNYDAASVDTITCEVARGDDQLASTAPRLVKIDVEGFELHVLRGLEHLLSVERPPLIMEMVSQHLVNAGSSVELLVSFLTERGYEAHEATLGKVRGQRVLVLRPADFSGGVRGDFLWTHRSRPDWRALIGQQPATALRQETM